MINCDNCGKGFNDLNDFEIVNNKNLLPVFKDLIVCKKCSKKKKFKASEYKIFVGL
jgi:hypothetical protein